MKMDFDYLNYLTLTKLKKVNGKKCQACKSFDTENKFLTQFGCTVKITLDIYQIHILLDKQAHPNDSKYFNYETINFMKRDKLTLSYL